MSLLNSIIMISLMSTCWWRKSIIMMLMSLEMLLISIFTAFSTSLSNPALMILFMLTIMAAGSSMGLSMLVVMARNHKSSNSLPLWILTFDKINYSLNFSHPPN